MRLQAAINCTWKSGFPEDNKELYDAYCKKCWHQKGSGKKIDYDLGWDNPNIVDFRFQQAVVEGEISVEMCFAEGALTISHDNKLNISILRPWLSTDFLRFDFRATTLHES